MEEFIKTLTEQMRCAKARDGVARELSGHISDKTQAYEQAGMEHDRAEERAVREMGDPVEIGISMDRIHQPQVDWIMLLITFVLSAAGSLCMIPEFGLTYMISRQSLFVLAGFAVIAAVYFIDYSVIGRIGAAAYIVMTVFLIALKSFFPTVNGRQSALFILVYLYVPVFAGILYQLRMGGYRAVMLGIALAGVTAVIVSRLSGSMMVALNIFLMLLVMLLAAVGKGMFCKNKKVKLAALVAIAAVLPAAVSLGYIYFYTGNASFRGARLDAFFHPEKYEAGAGWIYGVIDDILKNARLVGAGSTTYFDGDMIPQALSGELMPVVVIYSYGIIAGILMLALFAGFVLRAARIVRCQKNQLGFLVSLACLLVIAVNCIEGILVGVGLFPVTTTAIPFLTRGGSASLVYAVLIGLLLGVHRYEKVYPKETYAERPGWKVSLRAEKR